MEKIKTKGGNRKVNRRAKENQRQSPKDGSQTTRASRRDGKSKSGGKSNDSTGYKGKGNSTSGVCHRCGKPGHYARDCWASNMLELCSQRVSNYRILRLHNHCSHLQAQLQWEPQVQALSNSHQLSFELQEFMNLSFKVLQMSKDMMKWFLICAALPAMQVVMKAQCVWWSTTLATSLVVLKMCEKRKPKYTSCVPKSTLSLNHYARRKHLLWLRLRSYLLLCNVK